MSKWIIEADTERLQVPGDEAEWVEIKKRLTIGDQDTLKDKLIQIETRDGMNREERRKLQRSGDVSSAVKARYRPSTVALLTLAITDWSFVDGAGKKIPVTEDNIGKMDPWLANWLEDEIDQRNPLQPISPLPTTTSSKGGQQQNSPQRQ